MKLNLKQLQELEQKIPPNFTFGDFQSQGNSSDYIYCGGDIPDIVAKIPCFAHQNAGKLEVRHDVARFIIETRNALPDMLLELATLREIARELAGSDTFYLYDENCIYCGAERGTPHEADCLIEKAKAAIQ